MAITVQMPNAGLFLETCILEKWVRKAGDAVKAGDTLFRYETDKTTAEEVAPEAGILIETYFEEGDEVPVMADVCLIGSAEEYRAMNPQPPEER